MLEEFNFLKQTKHLGIHFENTHVYDFCDNFCHLSSNFVRSVYIMSPSYVTIKKKKMHFYEI